MDILNWFCETGRYDYDRLDEIYAWLSGTPEERRDMISQWGYGLNYKKLIQPCCWITREGAVYTVHWAGHARFMQDIGLSERWAEEQGWVKVTVSGVYCMQRPSPKQYRRSLEENMMRFLLDMDGVIADLDAGLRDEFGIIAPSRDELFNEYLPEYANRGGFAKSPVMPRATELLAMLGSYGEVAICTSIGQFADGDDVISQKKYWLDTHFPELSKAPFIATSSGAQKAFFAGTGILVDDWLANIQAFRAAGGRALHYTGQDLRNEVHKLWWDQ